MTTECVLQIVEKLLVSAVVDADVTVRRSIFNSLDENRGFDDYLVQADSLSAVFAALNDEVGLCISCQMPKYVTMDDLMIVESLKIEIDCYFIALCY